MVQVKRSLQLPFFTQYISQKWTLRAHVVVCQFNRLSARIAIFLWRSKSHWGSKCHFEVNSLKLSSCVNFVNKIHVKEGTLR